eukprot:9939638-Prorocentrum_lima.AAC.1
MVMGCRQRNAQPTFGSCQTSHRYVTHSIVGAAAGASETCLCVSCHALHSSSRAQTPTSGKLAVR